MMSTQKLFWLLVIAALVCLGCEQPSGGQPQTKTETETPGTETETETPGTETGTETPGTETPGTETETETPGTETEGEEEAPPVITGIEITSPPDTTYYARGQPFSYAGLQISWVWDNASRTPIAEGGYTLDPAVIDTSSAGPRRFTVRAAAEGKTYEAKGAVYVGDSTSILQSITVTKMPTKTVYALGETLSLSGMTISGQYYSSETEETTDGSVNSSAAKISGYDRYQRGTQELTVSVNGMAAPQKVTVTVNIPSTGFTLNHPLARNNQVKDYKSVYIKGKEFDLARSNLKATVKTSGVTVTLTPGNGINEGEVTGFDKTQTGKQTLTLTMDGSSTTFDVYVVDTQPALWFDYGYWRHAGDPAGTGPGEGKYYAQPNETLVLAPVRYLIGYNDDHTDAAAAYTWTVSGGAYDTAADTDKETFAFKPQAAGNYTVTVNVSGRNYVTGQQDTMAASTAVECYSGTVTTAKTFPDKPGLRHFAPGQFTEGGSGLGWSLGSAGGYWVYRVDPQSVYKITGNPMATWSEAGIVWVQEDKNGNNIPDEMWYELKGGDEEPAHAATFGKQITRRYALTYFFLEGSGPAETNAYNQIIRTIYWADGKGRTGEIGGGWSGVWGVSGNWVTFSGTLLRDTGNIATGEYDGLDEMGGYVDNYGWGRWSSSDTWNRFSVSDAIHADGSPAALNAVRFIKVQTAIFRYGGIFGDVSTEIKSADFLGSTTTFPGPDGGR